MLVYIAGPYTAPTTEGIQENIDAACAAAYRVLLRGHTPLLPHTMTDGFDRWHEAIYGQRRPYESYLEWDFALLRVCDGLLFLGSSRGADLEAALARELGKPVWNDVAEIPFDAPID